MNDTKSIVAKFDDLVFTSREYGGTKARFSHPNGWGVSVITGPYTYSENGTYEVAILKDNKINYDHYGDVLGYQTRDEITELLKELAEL